MTDRSLDLDLMVQDLAPIPVPEGLSDQTWAAIEREMTDLSSPQPIPMTRRPWRAIGLGLAMAAAALLFVQMPGEAPVADPERLVERGFGDSLPQVSLKVAVGQGDAVNRLNQLATYAPGDTLYFRASLDRSAWTLLVRVDEAGTQVLYAGERAAGEADLPHQNGTLAWHIESDESSAIYALLAAPKPLDPIELDVALKTAHNIFLASPDSFCAAVEPYGVRCSASLVHIRPQTEGGSQP